MSKQDVNYDGSYCPKCKSKNVEIQDNEHSFGYLELEIKCLACKCEYTSTVQVKNNKLEFNQVQINE